MEQHAWGRTGLRRERCDIPDGAAADLEAECRRYEDAIAAAGGLDLALLGVGMDGHIAYNMPGPLRLPTHVTRLPDGLAASLGVPPEDWPLRAITMGIGTIRLRAPHPRPRHRRDKATAVRVLVHGPEDPHWPCSFLTAPRHVELLADPGRPRAGRWLGSDVAQPAAGSPRPPSSIRDCATVAAGAAAPRPCARRPPVPGIVFRPARHRAGRQPIAEAPAPSAGGAPGPSPGTRALQASSAGSIAMPARREGGTGAVWRWWPQTSTSERPSNTGRPVSRK